MGFEIPLENVCNVEPISVGLVPVDLASNDYEAEALVESQEYGSSLRIETAYQPWRDLL